MSEPLTGHTITDEQIERLATDATVADDRSLVATCDSALYDDDPRFRHEARERCAAVINVALAMDDATEAA